MCNANDEARPGPADTPGTHPLEGDPGGHAATVAHAPFCNVESHEADLENGIIGCYGSYTKSGRVGGWLTTNDPGDGEARVALDWPRPPADWTSLGMEEAAQLAAVLTALVAEYCTRTNA